MEGFVLIKNGFTLMELICTLAILAVVITVSIPYAFDIGSIKFETAQHKLLNDIRYYQELSDFTNKTHTMIFYNTYYVISNGINSSRVYLPDGVKLTVISGSNTIKFESDGMPVGIYGSGCSLKLSYEEKNVILTIRPITGRVKIK